MAMKIIGAEEVIRLLDEKTCIGLMRDALIGLEKGQGVQYLRTPHFLPGGGIFAFMPAWLNETTFGAKVLSIFHQNKSAGLSSHQGGIMLFEAAHGTPLAVVDASSVTQIRTGAVSALATDLLARKDACRLALLGCGMQAESHLKAICHVRNIRSVTAWDIDDSRAASFAERMREVVGLMIEPKRMPREAVAEADIICTLTPSATPILKTQWVQKGAHINAVGACVPANRELPSALMAASRVYGDAVESVLKESGDFLIPMHEGFYGEEHLVGTIGAVAAGNIPGRQSDEEITIFDALGLAIEDIAAAQYVYRQG